MADAFEASEESEELSPQPMRDCATWGDFRAAYGDATGSRSGAVELLAALCEETGIPAGAIDLCDHAARALAPPTTIAPTTTAPTTTAPPTTAPPTTAAPTTTAPPPPVAAPVVISGAGDDVIDVTRPDGAGTPTVVFARHSGSANFIVQGPGSLLVNAIGSYEGVTLLDDDGEAAQLEVSADGPWTIEFRSTGSVRSFEGEASGRGDDVVRRNGSGGAMAWSHDGDSNFIVQVHSGGFPDLAINEIGPYQGTVLIVGGGALVVISANGAWSARAA